MNAHRGAVYAFAGVLLAIVAILIVPLPPPLLDLLLGLNVFGSALVLLLSVTVENPLEFSAFAPALLVATLFRLALDVSATRLILTDGATPGAVGSIIPAFGAFVVRGNLVVGLIVFAILITIQFVVIASGSQRVAEVAARFTLDAMPGKQMAIDADVHAGALDAEGARRKREAVQREADFYGAMDGAGKFIKGDAVAALVIVALNLIGGVAVGVAYRALSPLDALNTFALLSIGNALVTTLPAFLISTAMGMMVTRVASEGALGADLATQLFTRPDVLRGAGGLLVVLAFVPALPRPLFLVLAGSAFAVAQAAQHSRARSEREARENRERGKRHAMRRPELALSLVGVDAVAIEIGADLAALLAPPLCDALLDRIGEVRRALAADIGVVLPGVRLRDDLTRDPRSYGIRVRDRLAGTGRLELDRFLAVADAAVLEPLHVAIEPEPVYGLPSAWIAAELRERAANSGALVFDPISVLGSHLAEVSRTHAAHLVGRQELQTLLEHLRSSVPALVKEIGADGLPFAALHRAFVLLLREGAWPRDPVAVLEAMLEAHTHDPRELAEAARRAIVADLLRRRGAGQLEPIVFDAAYERQLIAAWCRPDAAGPEPGTAVALRARIAAYAARTPRDRAAVVCTAALRAPLADFLIRSGVRANVFAFGELPNEIVLAPAEVIEEIEPNALPACT
ncbi:MAG: FHIPEP family type III secretion protein [Candidatus Eremiobacteraeota bacterium]|nr:FHIPEP family type III secretion protein [Candidatus Eremiobacteraeota bacterium]